MRNLAKILSLKFKKIKIIKHFTRPKQRATLRKLFCLTTNHPQLDKILLRLWNKKFLMEIYIDSQSASRMQFLGVKNRNMFAGKFLSQKGFWLCCGSILFSTSSELRFVKWVRLFEPNCIVKWGIFFASFCWLWDFLLENLILRKTLMSTGIFELI